MLPLAPPLELTPLPSNLDSSSNKREREGEEEGEEGKGREVEEGVEEKGEEKEKKKWTHPFYIERNACVIPVSLSKY